MSTCCRCMMHGLLLALVRLWPTMIAGAAGAVAKLLQLYCATCGRLLVLPHNLSGIWHGLPLSGNTVYCLDYIIQ